MIVCVSTQPGAFCRVAQACAQVVCFLYLASASYSCNLQVTLKWMLLRLRNRVLPRSCLLFESPSFMVIKTGFIVDVIK